MKKNDNLKQSYKNMIFFKNVSLLKELEKYPLDKYKRKRYYSLKKEVLKDVRHIIYVLCQVSGDGFGIFDESGMIDIIKFDIYFDLAIEINEKILIPRNMTIEEYVKNLC